MDGSLSRRSSIVALALLTLALVAYSAIGFALDTTPVTRTSPPPAHDAPLARADALPDTIRLGPPAALAPGSGAGP